MYYVLGRAAPCFLKVISGADFIRGQRPEAALVMCWVKVEADQIEERLDLV